MSICVFTTTVNQYNNLNVRINRNWAYFKGYTFYNFKKPFLNSSFLHHSWEKVARAKYMLNKKSCKRIMWMDSDAVVNNPYFAIEKILNKYDSYSVVGSCNSPTGRGLKCDSACCHVTPSKNCFGIHDIGNLSPYPCLLNSGVFFMKNNNKSMSIVGEWLDKIKEQTLPLDPFFEQESLNVLRNKYKQDFVVIGGQVFNTHSIYDPTHTGDLDYFDVHLRGYTGFPTSKNRKLPSISSGLSGCIGSSFFICHNFARIDKEHIINKNVLRVSDHKKTAVCISGTSRSFFDEEVQLSYLRLHRPGFEYFLSTDIVNLTRKQHMVHPIRDWIMRDNNEGNILSYEHACGTSSCMQTWLLPMVQRFAYCFNSMKQYENKKHFSYEYILRLRPDHVFYSRLPSFDSLVKQGTIHIWDDQIAISHRKDAISVLAIPSLAYSVCHTSEQWKRCCPDNGSTMSCSDGNAPCEAFYSISLYSDIKILQLGWSARMASNKNKYDFCLKRTKSYLRGGNISQICSDSNNSNNICLSCVD